MIKKMLKLLVDLTMYLIVIIKLICCGIDSVEPNLQIKIKLIGYAMRSRNRTVSSIFHCTRNTINRVN
jgi:hypothetical protein